MQLTAPLMAQGSELCTVIFAMTGSICRSIALQVATAAAVPVMATLKVQGTPAVATATAMKPMAPAKAVEATVTGTAATAMSPWA